MGNQKCIKRYTLTVYNLAPKIPPTHPTLNAFYMLLCCKKLWLVVVSFFFFIFHSMHRKIRFVGNFDGVLRLGVDE